MEGVGGGWTGQLAAATVSGIAAADGPRPGPGSDRHGI